MRILETNSAKVLQLTVSALFIASSLVAFALPKSYPVSQMISAILFSAGLVVIVSSSFFRKVLFDQRASGVLATLALALWGVGMSFLSSTPWIEETVKDVWGNLLTISALGTFVMTLIIVVEISRTRDLPSPWKWFPLALLGIQSFLLVGVTLVVRMEADQGIIEFLTGATSFVAASTPIIYGILLLTLAHKPIPGRKAAATIKLDG